MMLKENDNAEKARMEGQDFDSPWIVTMNASIRADTRRLFNALTVPEYIEAWICPPGCHMNCYSVVARVDESYSIEHFCDGKRTLFVNGSYLVCQRRKLIFSWQLDGGLTKTCVDIRLCGDFESSTLQMRQSGLRSSEEYEWHRALWSASLAKLRGFFDVAPADANTKQKLPNRLVRCTVSVMR